MSETRFYYDQGVSPPVVREVLIVEEHPESRTTRVRVGPGDERDVGTNVLFRSVSGTLWDRKGLPLDIEVRKHDGSERRETISAVLTTISSVPATTGGTSPVYSTLLVGHTEEEWQAAVGAVDASHVALALVVPRTRANPRGAVYLGKKYRAAHRTIVEVPVDVTLDGDEKAPVREFDDV